MDGMNQEIIQKIELYDLLEKISIACGGIFLIVVVVFFWKTKIYQSIDFLSGRKKNKTVKKWEANYKGKKKCLIILVLIVGCCFLGKGHLSYAKIDVPVTLAAKKVQGENKPIKKFANMSGRLRSSLLGSDNDNIFNISTEELSNDLSNKPLQLKISTENDIVCDSQYEDTIFSRENITMVFKICMENFDQENGDNFSMQVLQIQEDSQILKKNIEKNDFIQVEDEEDSYINELELTAESGSTAAYKIIIEYQNETELPIIFQEDGNSSLYGKIEDGIFESKVMIIDKQFPIISEDIMADALKDKCEENEEIYYNGGIQGYIDVEEKNFSKSNIQLYAIPLDDIAKKSAESSENTDLQGNIQIIGWQCEQLEGDKHRVYFIFKNEGKWRLAFSCQDVVLNEGRTKGDENKHQIFSSDFIIDSSAPILTVKYNNVTEIHDISSAPKNVNKDIDKNLKKIISSECELYVKENAEIIIAIKENYFVKEKVNFKIFSYDYGTDKKRDVTSDFFKPEKDWKKEGEKYQISCLFPEEGHYQIRLDYKDSAGNEMQAGTDNKDKETAACLKQGIYIGPYYTIDKTEPSIEEFSFETEPEDICYNRFYFNSEPKVIVKIKEENFNFSDFSFTDNMFMANGNVLMPEKNEKNYNLSWRSYYENGERVNETIVPINIEANHSFAIKVMDGVKQNVTKKLEITYDAKEPELVYVKGDSVCTYMKYKAFRYFSKQKIMVFIMAKDENSGIKAIYYYYTDKNGERVKNSIEQADNSGKDVSKEDLSEYQACAIIDKENFKGNIHIYTEDYCGMRSKITNGEGMISESETFHKQNSELTLKLSKANFTDEKRKIKYYNASVTITAEAEDRHSGVKTLDILACEKAKKKFYQKGKMGYEIDKSKVENTETIEKNVVKQHVDYSDLEQLTYTIKEKVKISKDLFQESCEDNPINVCAEIEDNAGNISKRTYSEYKVVLDTKQPMIHVRYNDYKAKNKKYYNRTRIATITVKDYNFNPLSVKWAITGSNKKYRIGKWTGTGEIHQCKVIFSEDGENYRIKLSVADYAGNQTTWNEDTVFTIDKTVPKLEINMQQKDGKNGYYYNVPRTVFLELKEKNLDKDKINMNIKYLPDAAHKTTLISKKVSIHSQNDKHFASVRFKKDGEYRVTVQCYDLAGNASAKTIPLKFILDQKAPVISVLNVQSQMAYNKEVSPAIMCTDINLEEGSCHVTIGKSDGNQIGASSYPLTKKSIKNGVKIQWDDFPYEEWADDIYTLAAEVEDKAGNHASLGKEIVFSVNRFGSNYVMQEETKDILQNGYLAKEQDLYIKEIAVNQINSRIIILKNNSERTELVGVSEAEPNKTEIEKTGKEKESEKGTYTIYNQKTSKEKDGKEGWYVNYYRIHKENFAEEGFYQVLISSENYIIKDGKKQIIKETTNESRNLPIQFVIDKTPPIVRLAGLEERAYEEKIHPFTIILLDNFQLDFMNLKIHYENGKKEDKVIHITEDDLDENHKIIEELSSHNGYQIISYEAWDKAGNSVNSSLNEADRRCLVTTNQLVQTYYNHTLMAKIIMIGIVLILIMILIIWQWKRKQKKVCFDGKEDF